MYDTLDARSDHNRRLPGRRSAAQLVLQPQAEGSARLFSSDRDVPWWALAASIVATETSVVTFISVPAFAFAANARGEGGNFTFMQLVVGYMVGRLVIVALFIPLYFRGELFTVYQILDRRFGGPVKRVAASLFIVTRSLSDGVRIYATAIPLVALTGWADWKSILIIGAVMIVFTYLGGITAVIWIEVIQLLIYNIGAIIAGLILLNLIRGGWDEVVAVGSEAGKFRSLISQRTCAQYTFWAGVIGGAFLTTSTTARTSTWCSAICAAGIRGRLRRRFLRAASCIRPVCNVPDDGVICLFL
jgi:Na+/proline symporter